MYTSVFSVYTFVFFVYTFVFSVYTFVFSVYTFVFSVYTFFVSVYTFVFSVYTFVVSVYTFVFSVYTFVFSVYTFVFSCCLKCVLCVYRAASISCVWMLVVLVVSSCGGSFVSTCKLHQYRNVILKVKLVNTLISLLYKEDSLSLFTSKSVVI